jgi:hypothetical protein
MKLVQAASISAFTKKTLEQFGWQDGDPIPEELGGYLLELKNTLPSSARTDVLVDAALLNEEDAEKAREMIREAKRIHAAITKQRASDEVTKNMHPSVADAYREMVENDPDDGPQIIDDREQEEPAATPEAAAEQEKTVPPPMPPNGPSEVEGVVPQIALPFCQRCGWDVRNKFDVEITEADKQNFVAATLGGARFRKVFPLFGGKMLVTFKTMLAKENDLVHRQLVIDQQDGSIATEPEWFLRLFEYRLACSLDRITDANGKPVSIVPELGELPFTPPPDKPLQTPINNLLDYVNTKVIAHEVTRRLVGTHLRHFQRLVEGLEAIADDPSFWNGIA